jgi:hypothetical protein
LKPRGVVAFLLFLVLLAAHAGADTIDDYVEADRVVDFAAEER